MIFFLSIFVILNLCLIFFHKYISEFLQIYDLPSENKVHKIKTACTGGIYILINVVLFLILAKLYEIESFFDGISYRQLTIFLFAIICLLLIGVLDDKYKLSPNIKIVLFLLIFSIFVIFDSKSIITVFNLSFTIYSPHLNYTQALIFGIFCYFSFLNAFNMFDGINFQSIFYSIIFFLFIMIKYEFDPFMIVLLFSLISILFLNLKNLIFLGNNGTNFLSFIISYFVIDLYNNKQLYADEVLLLMLIPGIDMIRMVFERLRIGKNPFSGDLSHIHHLLNKKLNLFKTQLIINIPILISFISVLFMKINSVILIIIVLVYYFIIINLFKKSS